MLYDRLKSLVIAEQTGGVAPIGGTDPIGMMSGIPLTDVSGATEYQRQIVELLDEASDRDLADLRLRADGEEQDWLRAQILDMIEAQAARRTAPR